MPHRPPDRARASGRPLRTRELALAALLIVPLAFLFTSIAPIAQDPAYHVLADTRSCLGIPNFGNVATNLAFLVSGGLGLRFCLGRRIDGAARAWTLFFLGVALVAVGSVYYHLRPDNATLVWDRLPMTIAFMALFAALVAEHVRPELEDGLLLGAVLLGMVSVAWWSYTDDLRLYAWVQFAPFVALLYAALAFPARYSHRGYLVAGMAFYAAAKIAEFGDGPLYALTGGAISGHSLKHLLAAGAPYCVYLMLLKRKPLHA